MILVDTSAWIDHFRASPRAAALGALLATNQVVMHPWILGELATGNLGPRRRAVVRDLAQLPAVSVLPDAEVLDMIESRHLFGSGIGWVDAHLIGATLAGRLVLWTFDRAVARVVTRLGIMAAPGT